MSTYSEARKTAETAATVEVRLDAHAVILRQDSYGAAGSAIIAQNQSAALSDIAQGIAFIIRRNTSW